jgi:hypothetical protein
MDDKRVIVCNYRTGNSAVSEGSKAYVDMVAGDGLSLAVYVRSRGGRWIRRWERIKKMENFRFKTLPPEHPRYGDVFGHWRDSEIDRLYLCASD